MEENGKVNNGAEVGANSTFADTAQNRLAEASGKAVALAEPAKRGRGRPPGSKTKVTTSGGLGVAQDTTQGEAARAPIDREFIEKTFATGLKVFDGIITRKISSSVMQIHPSLDKQAEGFANAVALSEDEIKMASGTVGVLAEKYPRLFSYAPEITLGIFALSYGARVLTTFQDIKKLAAQVMEATREQMRQAEGAAPVNNNASPSQVN
jgi:hypothetical protein